MHEAALVRDLVRQVNAVAAAEGVGEVRTVRLWIGALSHLRDSDLRSRWPTAAAGTPAAGVRLEVITSDDLVDPRAQSVVLVSIGWDDATGPHAR